MGDVSDLQGASTMRTTCELFKYRTVNERTLSILSEGVAYFSSPEELNDPFDLIYDEAGPREEQERFIQERTNMGTDQALLGVAAMKVFEREVLSGDRRTRIYCVSEIVDSVLMWSHYADSHRGICVVLKAEAAGEQWWLGFERCSANIDGYVAVRGAADGSIRKLTATGAMPGVVMLPVHKVRYLKSLPNPFLFDSASDGSMKSYTYELVKQSQWSYEKERRIVINESFLKENPAHFAPGTIVGVVFGIKTTKETIVKIVQACKRGFGDRSLTYSRMVVGPDGVGLQRLQIPDIDEFIRSFENWRMGSIGE